MKLTELPKAKLVALALQFEVVDSQSKTRDLSEAELVAALEKNDDCVRLVDSVVR